MTQIHDYDWIRNILQRLRVHVCSGIFFSCNQLFLVKVSTTTNRLVFISDVDCWVVLLVYFEYSVSDSEWLLVYWTTEPLDICDLIKCNLQSNMALTEMFLSLAAQFYWASISDLYTIYPSDRTIFTHRDWISDLYTDIMIEIRQNHWLGQIRSLYHISIWSDNM